MHAIATTLIHVVHEQSFYANAEFVSKIGSLVSRNAPLAPLLPFFKITLQNSHETFV